jgi:hypothetical protein
MKRMTRNSLITIALGSAVVLAACSNSSDGPTYNPVQPPQALTLSALVNMVVTTQTSDTTLPVEIDGLAINQDLDDLALPNSDPNYASLIGGSS